MAVRKTKKAGIDPTDFVEEKARQLLALLGVGADLTVSYDAENKAVLVQIETKEDAGLLIGRRGETLMSIQYILSLMLKNKTDQDLRVLVNIGNWRSRQEEILKNLADSTAERVIRTGEQQILYNLTPSQRRIIHLYLSDNKSVVTESQGEGDERALVVKPRVIS